MLVLEVFSLKKSKEVHFNKSKIFVLYFYDAYDVILWEKSSAEARLIDAEQISLQNFIILWKKNRQRKAKELKQNIKSMGICGFT